MLHPFLKLYYMNYHKITILIQIVFKITEKENVEHISATAHYIFFLFWACFLIS